MPSRSSHVQQGTGRVWEGFGVILRTQNGGDAEVAGSLKEQVKENRLVSEAMIAVRKGAPNA